MNDQPLKNGSLVIVSASKYYAEYREACAESLAALGWQVQVQEDFRDISSFDGILVIGISFYRWPPFVPGQFRAGIQGEQMPLPGDADWSLHRNRKRFSAMSGYYDLVIDWLPSNYIHSGCSSPYIYLPHGAPNPSNQKKTEEWDIVFLGNPFGGTGRRENILKTLDREFNCCPIREAWGEEKYRLINSAKICLNLHQFSSASFESSRIFELLSEKAFVLSEKIENSQPFIEGRDYAAFSGEKEMIERIHYYLRNPEARLVIAKSGRKTALGFRQENMFKLLSIELSRCKEHKRKFLSNFTSWAISRIRNYKIEAIDLAAKMRRSVLEESSSNQ